MPTHVVRPGQRFFEVGLLALIAVLTLAVWSLSRQLRLAEQRLGPPHAAIGASAPSLIGSDLAGRAAAVPYSESGRPVLIYVFTPTCPWCQRNLANLKALIGAAQGRYRIVGLSLDKQGTVDYVARNQLHFDTVLTDPSDSVRVAYALGATPTTMVVSGTGRIERLWYGAYSPQTQREVDAYFRLRLPGLTSQ